MSHMFGYSKAEDVAKEMLDVLHRAGVLFEIESLHLDELVILQHHVQDH